MNDNDDHVVQRISDKIGSVVFGRISILVATFADEIRTQERAVQVRTPLRESIPAQEVRLW